MGIEGFEGLGFFDISNLLERESRPQIALGRRMGWFHIQGDLADMQMRAAGNECSGS